MNLIYRPHREKKREVKDVAAMACPYFGCLDDSPLPRRRFPMPIQSGPMQTPFPGSKARADGPLPRFGSERADAVGRNSVLAVAVVVRDVEGPVAAALHHHPVVPRLAAFEPDDGT